MNWMNMNYSKVSVLPVVFVILLSMAYQDNLVVVFESWRLGKPLILLRLDIVVPKVNADGCFIVIHRFSAKYAPDENGTERLFAGVVMPGTIVSVSKVRIQNACETSSGYKHPSIHH